MSNTRYRIPLQSISPNVIAKPPESEKNQEHLVGKGTVTRLSSLFGKSHGSILKLESAKPVHSADDREQGYIRQNASLAKNIAYLSKQIQTMQQENGTLRHRIALNENSGRIQQQKMKQSEEALEQVGVIRDELREILLYLEKEKEKIENESS